MIKIIRSRTCWHLFVDWLSETPFIYDDIKLLLEDLAYILEDYT